MDLPSVVESNWKLIARTTFGTSTTIGGTEERDLESDIAFADYDLADRCQELLCGAWARHELTNAATGTSPRSTKTPSRGAYWRQASSEEWTWRVLQPPIGP